MVNSQNGGRSNTAEKNPTIMLVFIFEDINNPIPLLFTEVNKVRTLLDPEADPMETYLSLLCNMWKKDEPDKRCFESSDYRLVDINNAELKEFLLPQGMKFGVFLRLSMGRKKSVYA